MRHRQPTWQDHDPEHVVNWTPSNPPRAIEGPLALDLFCDQLLVLQLAPAQVALHEVEGRVERAYLDQGHQLAIGDAPEQVRPQGHLVFVRTDVPVAWRWTSGTQLHVDAGGGESVDLPLRGMCAVVVKDPVRLYTSTLAGLEILPLDRLQAIFDTLVRAQLEQRLGDLAEHGRLDRVQTEVLLENLQPHDLDDDLADLGLGCRELNLVLADPADGAPHDATEAAPVFTYDDVF